MTDAPAGRMPVTSWLYPVIALAFYALASSLGFAKELAPGALGVALAVILVPVMFGAIFAAVHHAEDIAHATGEPYGTLVLTAAVTVIEVALIASVMIADPEGSPALARDTVYSVVMTIVAGLTGLCILLGGLRYREQSFRVSGATAYLAVLFVLATLTLVLPNYVDQVPGPQYSKSQLAFVGVSTIVLYGGFLYIQTVRHSDYFVAAQGEGGGPGGLPMARMMISVALLVLALTAVILLSKKFAVVAETARLAVGAPPEVTGLVVAMLILTPEGIAAVQAARKDALQKSLNLALGSALATIGLTFPAVAVVALWLDRPLTLGLEPAATTLLALTLLVSTLTFSTGRTNILFGFVHLVIFATFLFLTFQP